MKKAILILFFALSGCTPETVNLLGLEGRWQSSCRTDSLGHFRPVIVFSGNTFKTLNEEHATSDCSDSSPTESVSTEGTFNQSGPDPRESTAHGAHLFSWTYNGATELDIVVLLDGVLRFGVTIGATEETRPTTLSETAYERVTP